MSKAQPSEEIEFVPRPRSSGFLSGRAGAALLGALTVGAIWLATASLASRSSTPSALIESGQGEFKLDFMIQDSPTSASGSTLEGITAIEFYPSYVVAKGRDGAGRVFFTDKTKLLSWRR